MDEKRRAMYELIKNVLKGYHPETAVIQAAVDNALGQVFETKVSAGYQTRRQVIEITNIFIGDHGIRSEHDLNKIYTYEVLDKLAVYLKEYMI